jgi:hypothetical protein
MPGLQIFSGFNYLPVMFRSLVEYRSCLYLRVNFINARLLYYNTIRLLLAGPDYWLGIQPLELNIRFVGSQVQLLCNFRY